MSELAISIMAVTTIAALVLLIAVILLMRRVGTLKAELSARLEAFESESRKRVDKSRSVILGQVAEHFAPVLNGFPYNPKDARFMGQPVDYIVFNGMNDETNDGRTELEVVFCEIKSGGSTLSATERAIRGAVQAGRVRFEILRLTDKGDLAEE